MIHNKIVPIRDAEYTKTIYLMVNFTLFCLKYLKQTFFFFRSRKVNTAASSTFSTQSEKLRQLDQGCLSSVTAIIKLKTSLKPQTATRCFATCVQTFLSTSFTTLSPCTSRACSKKPSKSQTRLKLNI